MMKKICLFIFIFFSCALAFSEDISIEATISSNKISLKEAVQLTLTVTGIKDDMDPVALPAMDGLESRYLGPSTRISIVNGRYSSEHSYVYNLFPNKTGHIKIPSLTLAINGKDYTTKAIDLEVVESLATQNPGADADQDRTASVQSIKDHIFLNTSAPKTKVYMGEKLPIAVRLFVSQLPLRNIQFPKYEKDGYTSDNFAQPQQYTQDVNGVKFDVVDFRTFLYPTRTGELSVGPMRLDGSVLYKGQERGNPLNSSGFFNDDFFKGIFDSYQERPITVTADALKVNVLPLPEEGKPADFTGAVGQLDFTASISPAEVKVGDPVTLRMKISGTANYKSLRFPEFNDSHFKSYEPQIKDGADEKTLEQVIIPTSDTVTQVPAIVFNFFDPSTGQYKAITQGPFDLKVSAQSKAEEFKAVGFAQLPQGPTGIEIKQVDYVDEYIKKPIKAAIAFCTTLKFWLMVLCCALVWGTWVAWIRFRARLSTDTAFARRVNASRQAKQGLAEAKAHLNTKNFQAFYDALSKTLSNYLADKLHVPVGGLTWDVLKPLLDKQRLPAEQINTIKELFDRCDMVRFAAGKTDPDQMQQDLSKLQVIIAALR